MHLVDMHAGFWGAVPIVASILPIATGVAFAFSLRREARVSMVILGEGATEEGVFHESLQYAVFKRLPVVFVCENNGFAVNTPLRERRPPNFAIYKLAVAHGMAAAYGDGNDIRSVHAICHEAVERARSGQGPSFLEFDTYRWLEHCGPNDDHHFPCRSRRAYVSWKRRCPVAVAERQLAAVGVPEIQIKAIRDEERCAVETALLAAQRARYPELESEASGVYALQDEDEL